MRTLLSASSPFVSCRRMCRAFDMDSMGNEQPRMCHVDDRARLLARWATAPPLGSLVARILLVNWLGYGFAHNADDLMADR